MILAGIRHGHEGSASGVLTTVQQVGGAVGVAVIGVIFFGLLGSNAAASSGAVSPRIRLQLAAADVPGPVTDRVIAGFRTCFHDRASESDPTAIPPSCRRASSAPGSPTIGRVVGAAAVGARQDDFTTSVGTAWFYDVGVFGLTFLLVFLLPPLDPRALQRTGAAAA